MSDAFQTVTNFVGANILQSTIVGLAGIISVVSLYFVVSKRENPASSVVVDEKRQTPQAIEDATAGAIQILIEKEYIKGVVKNYLNELSGRPRFTFVEFMTYGVPALIAITFIGIVIYEITVLRVKQPSPYLINFLTIIVGYYFGAAAAKR